MAQNQQLELFYEIPAAEGVLGGGVHRCMYYVIFIQTQPGFAFAQFSWNRE